MTPPHTRRVRIRLVSTVALGVGAVVLVAGCSSTDSGSASTSPTASRPSTSAPGFPKTTPAGSASAVAELQRATSAAMARGWAHIRVTLSQGGKRGTITQISGPDRGEQTVQIGATTAKVLVSGGTAYIEGNRAAVTSYFGFPAADAAKLTGHWISIPSTDSDYAAVVDGVSLASVLKEIGLGAPLSLVAQTKVDGQTVVGVKGTDTSSDSDGGPGTLYVSVTTHLPVEFDSTTAAQSELIAFSEWGQSVALTVPADAIPISSIATH